MSDYVPGPRTSDSVTARDVAASGKIAEFRAGQLERLQGRAEKWIGGMTAITGLLTTAIVIKGPENFGKLSDARQALIVLLLVAGALALAVGVYNGYAAAHGDPFGQDALDRFADLDHPRVTGAADAWVGAVSSAISDARRSLKVAVTSTLVGFLVLGAAVVVTWTSEEEASATNEDGVCILNDDGEAVEVDDLPSLSDGSLTLVPCDDE